jgi:hypothetical protein
MDTFEMEEGVVYTFRHVAVDATGKEHVVSESLLSIDHDNNVNEVRL